MCSSVLHILFLPSDLLGAITQSVRMPATCNKLTICDNVLPGL